MSAFLFFIVIFSGSWKTIKWNESNNGFLSTIFLVYSCSKRVKYKFILCVIVGDKRETRCLKFVCCFLHIKQKMFFPKSCWECLFCHCLQIAKNWCKILLVIITEMTRAFRMEESATNGQIFFFLSSLTVRYEMKNKCKCNWKLKRCTRNTGDSKQIKT